MIIKGWRHVPSFDGYNMLWCYLLQMAICWKNMPCVLNSTYLIANSEKHKKKFQCFGVNIIQKSWADSWIKKEEMKKKLSNLMWTFPMHWSGELWCYTFDQQNPGKEPESEESGRQMELRLNSEEHREDWSSISHVINGIMKCNIMNIKFIMDPYLMKKENLTSYFLTLKWKKSHNPSTRKCPQRRNEKTPGKI